MKSNKKIIVGGLIAALGIGFAAISTNLYINGNLKAEKNFASQIKIVNKAGAEVNGKTTIDDTGKKLTFTLTAPLKTLGDTAEFTYGVSNESSYDAKVDSINCNPIGDNNKITEYTNVVATNNLVGKIVKKQSSTLDDELEDKITFTLKKALNDESEISLGSYQCELTVSAAVNASE